MTRDEAVAIEKKHARKLGFDAVQTSRLAEAQVDALIELGLLKVDEPYKPNFIYSVGGDHKMAIDVRHSTLNITPIVDKIGDTIGLDAYQVNELERLINEWRCYRG